jgi:hypothetical protein
MVSGFGGYLDRPRSVTGIWGTHQIVRVLYVGSEGEGHLPLLNPPSGTKLVINMSGVQQTLGTPSAYRISLGWRYLKTSRER